MRVPRLISEFIEWRWAPCVGLTLGSLAFVALSLLLIPTQIQGRPALADNWQLNRASAVPPPQALFGASLVQRSGASAEADSEAQAALESASTQELAQAVAAPVRGFSPVAERRREPEAEPAPAADSGRVLLQQPEPGGPAREVTVP